MQSHSTPPPMMGVTFQGQFIPRPPTMHDFANGTLAPTPPLPTFREALALAILSTIKAARKDGTTGMSLACLLQNTRTPSTGLSGAPCTPSGYREVFGLVVSSLPASARRFVISE